MIRNDVFSYRNALALVGATVLMFGLLFSIILYVERENRKWEASLPQTEVERLEKLRDRIRNAPTRSILTYEERTFVLGGHISQEHAVRSVTECGTDDPLNMDYNALRFLSGVTDLVESDHPEYLKGASECIKKIPVLPDRPGSAKHHPRT